VKKLANLNFGNWNRFFNLGKRRNGGKEEDKAVLQITRMINIIYTI
jgi:hypothetical protein